MILVCVHPHRQAKGLIAQNASPWNSQSLSLAPRNNFQFVCLLHRALPMWHQVKTTSAEALLYTLVKSTNRAPTPGIPLSGMPEYSRQSGSRNHTRYSPFWNASVLPERLTKTVNKQQNCMDPRHAKPSFSWHSRECGQPIVVIGAIASGHKTSSAQGRNDLEDVCLCTRENGSMDAKGRSDQPGIFLCADVPT